MMNHNKDLLKIKKTLVSIDGNLNEMTAGVINRHLDRLDKCSSVLCHIFIAEGRGYELPSETFKLTDPLALVFQELHNVNTLIRNEVSRRYGPGAPTRLPVRTRSTFGSKGR